MITNTGGNHNIRNIQANQQLHYQLPTWAHYPKFYSTKNNVMNSSSTNEDEGEEDEEQEWFLEEIKSGIVVNKYILDLPVITFGRIPLVLSNNDGDDITNGSIGTGSSTSSSNLFKSIVTAHESKL